jgi:hypothetical protein
MFVATDDRASNPANQSRERQLWCAVIGRAVQDAIQSPGPVGRTREQLQHWHAARRWFADNDIDFRRACEAAGFDPDYLRDRVLRLFDGGMTFAPLAPAISDRRG